MRLSVKPKNKDNINTGPFIQQTAFWGKVKEFQGCRAKAFDVEVSTCERSGQKKADKKYTDMLALLRPVGQEGFVVHVPYGPEFEPAEENQGYFLEQLSEALRPHLPKECLFIRYDLPWESPWANDPECYGENGDWFGPPREEIQEIRMNIPTAKGNLRKSPTNVLPANTVFLNLKKGRDRILQQMKAKTRYNIRLSKRKGVRVMQGGGRDLDIWYDLYKKTALRNNIYLHDKHFFSSMLEAQETHSDRNIELHLLLAEAEGDILAGMFFAVSEKQAVYLYGASSDKHKNKMATYALQWEAICRARKNGCRYYDMFGVSPSASRSHPMYGLYRFKTGFGGELYHRQGCWDYPLKTKKYSIYRAFELNDTGFHLRN